jgi:hypothetical protein
MDMPTLPAISGFAKDEGEYPQVHNHMESRHPPAATII